MWNTKRLLVSLCVILILSILSAGISFSMVEKMTLEDLVNSATTILRGRVISTKSQWDKGGTTINTYVRIHIDEYIKGTGDSEITVQIPGGEVGKTTLIVSDVPSFKKGERVILFLKDDFFRIVGWYQGKFTIKDNQVLETGMPLSKFIGRVKQVAPFLATSFTPPKGRTDFASIETTKGTLDFSNLTKAGDSEVEDKGPKLSGETLQPKAAGWVNIKTEGFEGVFPGSWDVFDNDGSTNGEYYWCDDNYKPHSGYWDGWPACGGAEAVNPPSNYPNDLKSWLVYGPFDLSDATDAQVLFYHWTKTEKDYDKFKYMASTDGTHFYGHTLSGDWTGGCWLSGGWCKGNFDLTNVPTLGDLRGESQVWIAFVFTSDYSNTYEGTFLDDITLRKYVNPPPSISSINPNSGPALGDHLVASGSPGCAPDSTRVTINGSNFGTSQGSSYVRFWRVFDQNQGGNVYYNGCIESWSDTRIVTRVPGGVSSGDVQVVTDHGTSNGVQFTVTFSYYGSKWSGTHPMGECVYINPNCLDGISEGNQYGAIVNAISTWTDVAADFEFPPCGLTSNSGISQDGENSISWVNYNTNSIATTNSWARGEELVEFDMIFNDFSYNWGIDGSGGGMDIQNVATHELGHALGLYDLYGNADEFKTMYGYSGTNSTKKRTLEPEDIDGIKYIYPPDSTKPSIVTDFDAVDEYDNVRTTWHTPSNSDIYIRVVKRRTDRYPSNHNDGYTVCTIRFGNPGDNDFCIDSDVSPGTRYYYAVFSRDVSGNWNNDSVVGQNADSVYFQGRSITVTSPNGGESWKVGSTYNITWTSSNAGSSVRLEYSTNGGSSWKTIKNSISNDGSYSWTVPDDPSSKCRVRVTSTSYSSISDTSDENFTIVFIDTTPPPSPKNLHTTPSEWTNNNSFQINWTNPSDYSGIAAAWYKRGAAPVSNSDGTRTTSHPFTTSVTAQGGQNLYVWLEDGAGNKNHNNRSNITLYYDGAKPTCSLSINNGSSSTDSLIVTLNLNGSDTGGSGLSQMQFSNNGSNWSSWENYSNLKNNWDLSSHGGNSNAGSKTVYVEVKDKAGNIGSCNDSIDYQPPNEPPALNNKYVAPTQGPPSTSFDYAVDFSDPENDTVTVTLKTKDPSDGTWENQGSKQATGTTLAWNNLQPFESNDEGLTARYKFEYDDEHNEGTWGGSDGYEGPTLTTNHSPTLSWTGETNYTTDGLNPESGGTGTTFTYRVKYTDSDNDSPASGYPKVHILKGGTEISDSPFTMSSADSNSYSSGRKYTFSKSGLAAGTDYSYYFKARDKHNASATGEATSSKTGPTVLTDPYEPNNNCGESYDLGDVPPEFQSEVANFESKESDWFTFNLTTRKTLVIDTQLIGSRADTALWLYGTCGGDYLTVNDDYSGLASHIEYSASPGTYYLRITGEYSDFGPDTEYTFTIKLKYSPAIFRVTEGGNVFADRVYYGANFRTSGADIAEQIEVIEPVEPGDVVAIDPKQPGYYRKSRKPYSTLVSGVISTRPGFRLGISKSQWENTPVNLTPTFNPNLNLKDISLNDLVISSRRHKSTILDINLSLKTITRKGNPHNQASLTNFALPGIESLFVQKYVGQIFTREPLLALMGVVPVKATTENGPIKPGDLLTTSSKPGHVMACKDRKKCAGAIVGKALDSLKEGNGVIKMLVIR